LAGPPPAFALGGIGTDPPGLQLATIGENHGDLVSTINDMRVGENDTLAGVDHDTGAGRPDHQSSCWPAGSVKTCEQATVAWFLLEDYAEWLLQSGAERSVVLAALATAGARTITDPAR
jgi:hypothetical protein